jgi:hypothetical protein
MGILGVKTKRGYVLGSDIELRVDRNPKPKTTHDCIVNLDYNGGTIIAPTKADLPYIYHLLDAIVIIGDSGRTVCLEYLGGKSYAGAGDPTKPALEQNWEVNIRVLGPCEFDDTLLEFDRPNPATLDIVPRLIAACKKQ